MTRGIRNNNPGNLRKTAITWKGKVKNGTDQEFEQFETMVFGVRAAAIDIGNDIFVKKQDTIRKLITRYAPPHENNTDQYVRSIVRDTGIGENDDLKQIGFSLFVRLLRAIFKVENGAAHKNVSDQELIQGAHLATQNIKGEFADTPKKKSGLLSFLLSWRFLLSFGLILLIS